MAALPRSARALRALCSVTCLFSLIQACGGRSDTEDYLFGADGSISQGASSNTTAGRPSGSAGTRNGTAGVGATTSTGGVGNTGATTGTGGVGNTGATSPTGGAIGVAGTGVVQGGATVGGSGVGGAVSTAGAAGAPAVVPITCGAEICDANTQSCCAGLGGFGCIGKHAACNGAVLGCTTNADCAGNGICCISITGDVDAASTCKSRCDNTGTGRDRQLCETAADCQAPSRFCTPTIFGVNICTRRGP